MISSGIAHFTFKESQIGNSSIVAVLSPICIMENKFVPLPFHRKIKVTKYITEDIPAIAKQIVISYHAEKRNFKFFKTTGDPLKLVDVSKICDISRNYQKI